MSHLPLTRRKVYARRVGIVENRAGSTTTCRTLCSRTDSTCCKTVAREVRAWALHRRGTCPRHVRTARNNSYRSYTLPRGFIPCPEHAESLSRQSCNLIFSINTAALRLTCARDSRAHPMAIGSRRTALAKNQSAISRASGAIASVSGMTALKKKFSIEMREMLSGISDAINPTAAPSFFRPT